MQNRKLYHPLLDVQDVYVKTSSYSSLSIFMHVSHSLSKTRLIEQAFSSTQLHYHHHDNCSLAEIK
jgi:hypothetical protein